VRHEENLTETGPNVAKQKSYRRDIDGLRAVAVLLVVVFHLGGTHLDGGFIGVDMFFVISGYLITGIITRDMAEDRFTILGFYERRVRRIFPALSAVLFACSVACYFFLPPTDLLQYAHSLFSSLFSYANFYFWTQADYFAPTYMKVLLHTWSLAVEEQFYLLLPAALLLLRRRPALLRPALLLSLAASLSMSAWLSVHNVQAAFFTPHARAWELLIGSALALGIIQVPKSRRVREMMAISGALMIAFAALTFSAHTPLLGVAMLLPCIGSALLLSTGEEGTFVSSLLSSRPLVSIGLISYSVYLWHWPVILFAKMGIIPGITFTGPRNKIAILVVSLVLGWLSWMFIEQPFRAGRFKRMSRRTVFACALASSSIICAIGATYAVSHGLPSRFPSEAVQVASYLGKQQEMRIGTCFISTNNSFADYLPARCAAFDPTRHNYLLFGDSHAAALWFGLQEELAGANVMQATASGCAPTFGRYDSSDCGKMRQYVYESYLPNHPVDGVILTERWSQSSDIDHIAPAIAWFKSRSIPVIAVGPVQEYDVPLPMLLAFAIKRHDASLPERHIVPNFVQLDQRLQARMAEWQVPYLSPLQTLCPAGHCREYVDSQGKVPTLADDNHLTNQASLQIAKEWAAGGHFLEIASMKDVAVTQPPLSAGTMSPIPMAPDQPRTMGDLRSSTIDILRSHGTRYGRGGS
jgi:peptidoglycan/LPS O-acetylase OafA/YrhL